jgi:hypothetical protein
VLYQQNRPSTLTVLLAASTLAAVFALASSHYSFGMAAMASSLAMCGGALALARGLSKRDHSFPANVLDAFERAGTEDNSDDDDDDDDDDRAWGASAPAALTTIEMQVLNYFSSVTHLLPKSERPAVWAMLGAGKAGGTQFGFTSIRYHLSFLGYAAAFACSRTPCYQGLLRKILDDVIEHLLDHRCWCYMRVYWKGADRDPFFCSENIMYSGHLLQLVTM